MLNKKEYDKKYCQEHKEKLSKNHKEYYQKHKEELKEHYQENKEKMLEYKKNKYKQLRLNVINHYGGKCSFCGNTNINHLCMDHINNDGAEHRRKIGIGGTLLYRWIKKNNYPDGFQVLCYNHNAEKEHHKIYSMAINIDTVSPDEETIKDEEE